NTGQSLCIELGHVIGVDHMCKVLKADGQEITMAAIALDSHFNGLEHFAHVVNPDDMAKLYTQRLPGVS
ncbi:hypothetical protein XarbCFBP8152_21005, partial [Xanthomonas arboricola]